MRNFIFTSALLAAATTFSWAQPVINYSNLNNNIRLENFLAEDVPNLSPGNAGANQTWDYSAIQADSYGISENVPIANAPHRTTFTTANTCSHFTGSLGEIWTYSLITPTKYEEIGIVYVGVAMVNLSSNPRTFVEFPYTYNKTINDTYAVSGITYSFSTLYDAYGTLRLPFGTFNNVVRQKRIENASTEYTWFNVNPFYPICTVNVSNGSSSITMIKNLGTLATEQFDGKSAVVSPNPTTDIVNIQFSEQMSGAIATEIFDISGKMIFSRTETASTHAEIDLSDFDSGVYFLKITNNGKTSTQKIIKK